MQNQVKAFHKPLPHARYPESVFSCDSSMSRVVALRALHDWNWPNGIQVSIQPSDRGFSIVTTSSKSSTVRPPPSHFEAPSRVPHEHEKYTAKLILDRTPWNPPPQNPIVQNPLFLPTVQRRKSTSVKDHMTAKAILSRPKWKPPRMSSEEAKFIKASLARSGPKWNALPLFNWEHKNLMYLLTQHCDNDEQRERMNASKDIEKAGEAVKRKLSQASGMKGVMELGNLAMWEICGLSGEMVVDKNGVGLHKKQWEREERMRRRWEIWVEGSKTGWGKGWQEKYLKGELRIGKQAKVVENEGQNSEKTLTNGATARHNDQLMEEIKQSLKRAAAVSTLSLSSEYHDSKSRKKSRVKAQGGSIRAQHNAAEPILDFADDQMFSEPTSQTRDQGRMSRWDKHIVSQLRSKGTV